MPALSLVDGNQVVNVAPTANLVASSEYQLCINGQNRGT